MGLKILDLLTLLIMNVIQVPMYKHKKLDILQLPVKSSLEHIQISSELAARLVPQEVNQ